VPRRTRRRQEYARIPVVIHGIVRVPVPLGLSAAEVERAARDVMKGSIILDAVGFVDGIRLVADAATLAVLTEREESDVQAVVGG
jgi:hypothetical protein